MITVASQIALGGGRGSGSYARRRAPVINQTRAVALDYAVDNVRANARSTIIR